jgi:signal transduction histidine kinase
VQAAALTVLWLAVTGVGIRAKLLDGGYDTTDIVLDLSSSALLFGCGIGLRSTALHRRMGSLLVATGLAYSAEDFITGNGRLVYSLGALLVAASAPVLLHAVLAFPSGRLESRVARVDVAVAYATAFVLEPMRALARPGPYVHGFNAACACPRPYVRLPSDWYGTVVTLSDAALAVVASVAVVVLLDRWRRTSRVARRGSAPFLAVATLTAVCTALEGLLLMPYHVGWHVGTAPIVPALTTVADIAEYALPLVIVFGLLHGRLLRGGAGSVALAVAASGDPVVLRDALATALHDPTLRVGFPVGGRFEDVDGVALTDPPPAGRMNLPLGPGDAVLALVQHDAALADSPELLASVGAAATLALDNVRLQQDLERRLAEITFTRRRVVQAADDARRRVERDLHDGAQQRLLALAMLLKNPDAQDADHLRGAADQVLATLHELRDLARGIYPTALAEAGLPAALASLVDHTPVAARLECGPIPRLPPEVEHAAYFTASEGLANALKHSCAGAIVVRVVVEGDALCLEVRDDGCGGADPASSGLRGVRDRLLAVDGALGIVSPPGGGTTLTARIPLPAQTRTRTDAQRGPAA